MGRKRAKKKDGNGATLGFEQTLWQVAAAACSSSTPMRDGLENSTFSPQAFGERLAVGNPSSWFAPTLGMSSFNFYADCGPQATAAMPPYSRHEALIWPLTSPSLRVRLPGFIQRKRAAAAIRDR